MGTFNEIIKLIDTNLIRGIFSTVLVVIFCRKIFKTKFDTRNAITIVRGVIIGYSALILIEFLLIILLPSKLNVDSSFIRERATGPYSWAFWMMAIGAISPLILLLKKLGNKVYLILILTIFMNVGWLMEHLVIHTVIIERDYGGRTGGFKAYLPSDGELMIIAQGIILGILAIAIGNLPFFRKNIGKSA